MHLLRLGLYHPKSLASVTPIDKGGTDRHICTNYRPVSVLKNFQKRTESSIFDQLTKHVNEFLQTFVGAYKNHTAINIFYFVYRRMENATGQKLNSWSGVT